MTTTPVRTPKYAKMIPERRTALVAALRSGKYGQAVGQLCTQDRSGFCCLGVAADLVVPEGVGHWVGTESGPYGILFQDEANPGYEGDVYQDESRTNLTHAVAEAYFTSDTLYSDNGDAYQNTVNHLIEMNDGGSPFEEIAQWIEENL